ncbi:MAG: hypothetical protein ACKVP7_03080 [Hyphomicrobiaceae bacterium]
MHRAILASLASSVGLAALMLSAAPAAARSCADLRALCWTMRTDKSDCTGPYQRCLKTGVFITPLGRRFVATTR